jgi:hypothetical protein
MLAARPGPANPFAVNDIYFSRQTVVRVTD